MLSGDPANPARRLRCVYRQEHECARGVQAMTSYNDYLTGTDDYAYRFQVLERIRQDNRMATSRAPSWLKQKFVHLLNVIIYMLIESRAGRTFTFPVEANLPHQPE
jgi:hypothetical protein